MLNSRDIDDLRADVAANCRVWMQLCRDAGAGALAQKLELVGKAVILCACLPVLVQLCDVALSLLA